MDSLHSNEELRDKLIFNGFVNAVNEIKDKLGEDIINWDWEIFILLLMSIHWVS